MKLTKKHIALSFLFWLVFSLAYGQTYVISDTNLKQCIITKDPALLNANGDLIIANAANATGEFYCAGDGVSNVDGLQFFTGITELNIGHNPLTDVSAISNLSQLVVLKLDNCELSSVPSLNDFSALEHLDLFNNNLILVPNLPENSRLTGLNVSQNFLTQYPDLSKQSLLEYINLSRNNGLKTIITYNNLTAVKEFSAYLCGLSDFPDVSMMTNLETLNIGYNNLTTIPDLSANQNLVTLYANNNSLVSFEDLSSINTLEKVRLYNNYLSYEDLEPLLNIPNYSDIYKYVPQYEFPNPLKSNYYEADSISFVTGIANTANNVTYSWYYQGSLLWESSLDTLNIPFAQPENSGAYYFIINSSDFPELTLNSSTTSFQVSPCINETGFTVNIEGATCTKAGSIYVKAENQPQKNLSYSLESTTSGKIFYSETGNFKNLNTPEYILYTEIGRCKKEIDIINLPIESCEEAYFTPNGDGEDDSYYFQQEGTATIYNKFGQKIQDLTIPLEWDGSVKNNGIIAPGYYTVDINNGEEVFHLSVVY